MSIAPSLLIYFSPFMGDRIFRSYGAVDFLGGTEAINIRPLRGSGAGISLAILT